MTGGRIGQRCSGHGARLGGMRTKKTLLDAHELELAHKERYAHAMAQLDVQEAGLDTSMRRHCSATGRFAGFKPEFRTSSWRLSPSHESEKGEEEGGEEEGGNGRFP
jgi:hypothetical protein